MASRGLGNASGGTVKLDWAANVRLADYTTNWSPCAESAARASVQRASFLIPCGVVQFGNSIYRFIDLVPDAVHVVKTADWVNVLRPGYGCE